ncbi:MAG: putative porin [Thermoanaerobaculia bacterium]
MHRSLLVIALALSAAGFPARADEEVDRKVRLFGDFRLRLEQDWDSLQGDGSERDDRLRLRIRLRGGVEFRITDTWSALVQARTGPNQSQQSPHITIYDFDGGPTGPYDLNLDYWYLGYASGGFEVWAGRNQLSFWHHDDLFVFDNVTYPGAGASYRHGLGEGALTWRFNYVALPVGMRDFSGTGIIGQVAYELELENSGFTVAGGFIGTRADPDDPAGEILLTENNTRDYRLFDLQLQYRSQAFGRPFKIGFDYTHNAEDYDDAPPGSFSELHRDHVDGYVFELLWGETGDAGNWQLGYYYAHLEALAANSSYIQDDWVRWGDANQVRATNLKGSELRLIYTIRPNMNLFARLFFVDAIDLLEPGDTTKETGNRLRIDWNVSF